MDQLKTESAKKFRLVLTRQYMPQLSFVAEGRDDQTLSDVLLSRVEQEVPIWAYARGRSSYATVAESSLSNEEIIALEGKDEPEVPGDVLDAAEQENSRIVAAEAAAENQEAVQKVEDQVLVEETLSDGKVQEISREKLNDFDYLLQNFYNVDSTTTITGSQLNAQELLGMDLTIKTPADQPQILIYHTHSQEMYADSDPNDVMTGVMGAGEYLKQLLEGYGFSVIHHMGQYDVGDRDHAYSNAEDAIAQILEENPSIEVVIDLHRDSVERHMVRNVNGVEMAPVMFFNGLSYTNALGNITYLDNPNLKGNLAFSLQMQIAAEEYYPNLTRPIYLKGYRYNMHFREKTLLVELGSYTNTQGEIYQSLVPLADLLDKVLHNKS
ncbi:MAG: stage II sporulation protein P [Lachnospiraceae bacterium]|nr:stage II sporulation protein P [Lachnospiraceae bacterium]